MIISEKQIMQLISHLRDFIEDNTFRSCIDEPARLLLDIENQQSEELKVIE